MVFQVITIFPKMFESYLNQSILKKALDSKIIQIKVTDLRDYANPPHRVTDDYPYGGDPGMVMKPEPFFECFKNLRETFDVILACNLVQELYDVNGFLSSLRLVKIYHVGLPHRTSQQAPCRIGIRAKRRI